MIAVSVDQIFGCGGVLFGDEELHESAIERRFIGIALDPGTILQNRIVLWQALLLNDGEDPFKRLPGSLMRYGIEPFGGCRRCAGYLGHHLELIERSDSAMIEICERDLSVDLLGGM